MDIDWYEGNRTVLRPLFEYAEDSETQLDTYLPQGRILVGRLSGSFAGHLQLVPTDSPEEIELKNMAVAPRHRGTGVGRALVGEARRRCADEGWRRMIVAAAAADIGNLRFYQRVGFRMQAIEPDAFTPATGYPEPIHIDGIPLLDRVWLACEL